MVQYFRCVPKTAIEHAVIKNILVNIPGGWASYSTHSPCMDPSSPSPNYPCSPACSPSPQPTAPPPTSLITVCSPVPNQPLLRRPNAYPTYGNRRVEKRPRIEVDEVGDNADEGGDAPGDTADEGAVEGEAVDAGDITELQVLQRYK